ncbi:hypothetical protein N7471_009706 [Penicillium samsonianum]|uniref:uncharacterized protein n=1 Tax=Penicillium samsonianum TaxID=1882272 RepID=UPI002548073F|nr:uncharacterized protein N7471_009706 [Penicillium samsonianum]KAJ6128489.1 hypothetical protein N7471_009706 [Penicillium samsonianum]
MKASILLLAASAGLALAQPASLSERDDTSGVCPTFGAPWEPTAACCFYTPWSAEHLPGVVCLKATSTKNTADFEEGCRKVNETARPRCCPKAAIAENENDLNHDDLLCTDPKVVS